MRRDVSGHVWAKTTGQERIWLLLVFFLFLCVHFSDEDEEEEDIYDYTVRAVWGRPPSDSIERNKIFFFFSLDKNQVGLKILSRK